MVIMYRPIREKGDSVLPKGTYRSLEQRLQARDDHRDVATLFAWAFDPRTDIGPYIGLAKTMGSATVLQSAASFKNAGFDNTRIVLRQHNPKLKVSRSKLQGKPIEQLMISAMGIHVKDMWTMIEDAHTMEERPLIVVGGPDARYQPHMMFGRAGSEDIGADVVVTGEVYTGLELEERILERRKELNSLNGNSFSMRDAFEDLAIGRELDDIPGLMYKTVDAQGRTVLVDTHVERKVEHLDEMPGLDIAMDILEPSHKRKGTRENPLDPRDVKDIMRLYSLVNTRGCRIGCDFCPIPAGEGNIFRTKGSAMAEEQERIAKKTGIVRAFRTDDNIADNLEALIKDSQALAERPGPNGGVWGDTYVSGTEATNTDLYRLWQKGEKDGENYFELMRDAGIDAIWMGNEDINGAIVDEKAGISKKKGVTIEKVRVVLRELRNAGIAPMLMNIYTDHMEYTTLTPDRQHDDLLESLTVEQLRLMEDADHSMQKGKKRKSDKAARAFVESLSPEQEDQFVYGLREQSLMYTKHGAVSQQITMLTPAVGTNLYERPWEIGEVFATVNGRRVDESKFDGNHMVMTSRDDPAQRLEDVYGGYGQTYNVHNLVEAWKSWRDVKKSGASERQQKLQWYQLMFQLKGIAGRHLSIWKQRAYLNDLRTGDIKRTSGVPQGVHPVIALHPDSYAYYARTAPEVSLDMEPFHQTGELPAEQAEKLLGELSKKYDFLEPVLEEAV